MKSGKQVSAALVVMAALAGSGCVGSGALHGVGSPSSARATNASVQTGSLNAGVPLDVAETSQERIRAEDTASQAIAAEELPELGENKQEAVEAIRAKSAQPSKGKTNVFRPVAGATRQLTDAEQAAIKRDLLAAAAENERGVRKTLPPKKLAPAGN